MSGHALGTLCTHTPMKESIVCLTTDYKFLLRTFTVHSQRMGKGGENCMKSFVTHPK